MKTKISGPNDLAHQKLKPEQLPFYAAKGSDPDAPMKGDFQQQVPKSRAMQKGTPVKKPKAVKSGGAYKLR